MVDSITQLLRQTAEAINRAQSVSESYSGVVFVSSKTCNTKTVLEKIKLLESFCEDIVVGIYINQSELLDEMKSIVKNPIIKIVQAHYSTLSTMVIEELLRFTLNDKVLFIASECDTPSKEILEKLRYLKGQIVGILTSKGKVSQNIFFLYKWDIRFFLQILRLTARTTFNDLLRILPAKNFIILNNHFQTVNSGIITFYSITEQQNLIKMVALLRYLQEELINNKRIRSYSSFKLQQLLAIAKRMQKDNKFLSFLVPNFIIHYYQYIEELPPTWRLSEVENFAKEVLKEEIEILEKYKLTELTYECILDLLEQNLSEEERKAIEKKKEIIEKDLF